MTKVLPVTTAAFEQDVLRRSELVLLDLWATWCGPCRALSPVLDDLAADFGEEVAIRKIDIEAEPDLRDRLTVGTVPTLILFRDGAEVDRVTGAQSRTRLAAWVERHL
jgi:thioredoxin 1